MQYGVATCDTIEKILRQLEAQGESTDEQWTLLYQIISKFPAELIVKLEEFKEQPVRTWHWEYNIICLIVVIMSKGNRLCPTTSTVVMWRVKTLCLKKVNTGPREQHYSIVVKECLAI